MCLSLSHLQLCEIPSHGWQVPVLVVAEVQQLQAHEVANAAGQTAQPIARHQQLLQRGAAPHHARHAGQAVAAAVQHLQGTEGAQGFRQGLQAVACQTQHLLDTNNAHKEKVKIKNLFVRTPTQAAPRHECIQHAVLHLSCTTCHCRERCLLTQLTGHSVCYPTTPTLRAVRATSSSGTAVL